VNREDQAFLARMYLGLGARVARGSRCRLMYGDEGIMLTCAPGRTKWLDHTPTRLRREVSSSSTR
jgi:hypothetical protein